MALPSCIRVLYFWFVTDPYHLKDDSRCSTWNWQLEVEHRGSANKAHLCIYHANKFHLCLLVATQAQLFLILVHPVGKLEKHEFVIMFSDIKHDGKIFCLIRHKCQFRRPGDKSVVRWRCAAGQEGLKDLIKGSGCVRVKKDWARFKVDPIKGLDCGMGVALDHGEACQGYGFGCCLGYG